MYSVPQNSKLDPSLIIIDVYDFKQCPNYSTSILFAVDTNTFVTGDNVNSSYSKANQELKNMNAWMVANKLSIDINKTVHMLFWLSSRKTIKQN